MRFIFKRTGGCFMETMWRYKNRLYFLYAKHCFILFMGGEMWPDLVYYFRFTQKEKLKDWFYAPSVKFHVVLTHCLSVTFYFLFWSHLTTCYNLISKKWFVYLYCFRTYLQSVGMLISRTCLHVDVIFPQTSCGAFMTNRLPSQINNIHVQC